MRCAETERVPPASGVMVSAAALLTGFRIVKIESVTVVLTTRTLIFTRILPTTTFATIISLTIIIFAFGLGELFIMAMWNPWRGCRKCSEGCLHCYIHKGDVKRGIDTNHITKTKDFYKPIEQLKSGKYKMNSGIVYLCFSTDFLIEEADQWRKDCWNMIKQRQDCTFLFLTKRIERFADCIPDDWNDGYENVVVGCTIENQKNADKKLSLFASLPIKHKCITAQPLLEKIYIEPYLDDIELVVVGGESDYYARPFNYDWALDIREQCIRKNVSFEFRQCGTHFIKDGVKYKLQTKDLCSQARKAGIDFKALC